MVNPTNRADSDSEISELQLAAQTLRLRLLVLNVSKEDDFEPGFAWLAKEQAAGALVSGDALFFGSDQLVATAAIHKMPVIYRERGSVAAGGLISYGTDYPDAWRRVGAYAGRILKGGNPGDLPVQLVTKLELVLNMRTGKTLGLIIPLNLLGRADEVIE